MTAGDYVLVAVSDTGAGMTPEVLGKVFEPFFTTKDVGEGSGLGLSMVYGFAKQSGGHVDIESIPGDGTTIRLYLPLVAPGETELAPPKIAEAVVPGGNETILIVEYDPEVRTLVRAIIEGAGYRVLEADDGPTAIALLEELPKLDLVLSDIMLPGGMNGMELATVVRRRFPEIIFLFTTGYPDHAVAHRNGTSERQEFLGKPYTRDDLAQTVRRLLDQ